MGYSIARKKLRLDRMPAAEAGLPRQAVGLASPQRSAHQLKLMEVQGQMDRSPVVSRLQTLQAMADARGGHAAQGMQNGTHGQACGCPGCTGQQQQQQPATTQLAVATVQRYCDMPGCTNPKCNNINNHKYTRYRKLRNTRIYSSNVSKRDIGKGSATNQKVRDYVQDRNAYYPEQVEISYRNQSGTLRNSGGYNQPPLGYGEIPDAGHINGNQFGGSGTDPAGIFAQHKKFNRGNSYNGEKTFSHWRGIENQIRSHASKGVNLEVMVKLRDQALQALLEGSISEQEYRAYITQLGLDEDYDDQEDSDYEMGDGDDYDSSSDDDMMGGGGGVGITA